MLNPVANPLMAVVQGRHEGGFVGLAARSCTSIFPLFPRPLNAMNNNPEIPRSDIDRVLGIQEIGVFRISDVEDVDDTA